MLTKTELSVILESLKYTKLKFEEYQGYPSQEFKKDRINEIVAVMNKVKQLQK